MSKHQVPPDPLFLETFAVCRPVEDVSDVWFKWAFIYGVDWEDTGKMRFQQIGECGGNPVTVTVGWARIGGKLVALVEGSSQVVDYHMLEVWCSDVFPNARSYSNSTNFHNIILDIEAAVGFDVDRRDRAKVVNHLQNLTTMFPNPNYGKVK